MAGGALNSSLDETLGAEGHMPFATDDDMVMDRNAQQPTSFSDALGNLNVGPTWLGASTGVVVDKDQRARSYVHRPPDHLARKD